MAGLKNQAVVWSGRLAKCLEVDAGEARLVWIDSRDRLVERSVPASACVKFSDATRVRSFWPDSNVAFDEGEEPPYKAKRNRKRVARDSRKKAANA